MTTIESTPVWDGLPDPETEAEFYEGVPTKRAIAWCLDVTLIGIVSVVLVPFTLFTALFYFPVLMAVVGFLYRWVCLTRGSATLGMRLTGIEIRDHSGARLDPTGAFLHTAGYAASLAIFPLQLVSIALMLISPRAQGLTDHGLGTAAINRPAEG
ncbi:RDD family protein [Mesobaculum littorinae]|uniref:RDD family protein n=1 Tax=Mesobaculum littorinae TaxID=2486419 RepID=A0A438AMD7_9RHOB|nr:RDD family protein [Mesobaculum littorinae]RVV99775.1 RDD family protein [Mesobaculum littorinae]